jgi:hypothetical protein
LHTVCTSGRRDLSRPEKTAPAAVQGQKGATAVTANHTRHHPAAARPECTENACASTPGRTTATTATAAANGTRRAAGDAYPQITAARRAACAVIERGGLPGIPVAAGTAVPAGGLLAYLTDPQRTGAELDAVWRVLLDRARREADWQLVALGMTAPRLVQITARAAGHTHPALREEVAAAVLGAFAEAVLTLAPEPGRGLLVYQLLRRAQAAAQRVVDQSTAACRRAPEGRAPGEGLPASGLVGRAPNHPDIALARLVARGVISADEAELIGRHRIEGVSLRRLGAQRGWYPMQTTRALRAAERKVADDLGHQTDKAH